jgi:hypothetical protein
MPPSAFGTPKSDGDRKQGRGLKRARALIVFKGG